MNEIHSKRIRVVVATSLSDLGGDFLRSRHAKLDGIANMRTSDRYGPESIRLNRFRPLLAPSHVAPSHEVAVLVQTKRRLVRSFIKSANHD